MGMADEIRRAQQQEAVAAANQRKPRETLCDAVTLALNEVAPEVAAALRELGIKPNKLVDVYFVRTLGVRRSKIGFRFKVYGQDIAILSSGAWTYLSLVGDEAINPHEARSNFQGFDDPSNAKTYVRNQLMDQVAAKTKR